MWAQNSRPGSWTRARRGCDEHDMCTAVVVVAVEASCCSMSRRRSNLQTFCGVLSATTKGRQATMYGMTASSHLPPLPPLLSWLLAYPSFFGFCNATSHAAYMPTKETRDARQEVSISVQHRRDLDNTQHERVSQQRWTLHMYTTCRALAAIPEAFPPSLRKASVDLSARASFHFRACVWTKSGAWRGDGGAP